MPQIGVGHVDKSTLSIIGSRSNSLESLLLWSDSLRFCLFYLSFFFVPEVHIYQFNFTPSFLSILPILIYTHQYVIPSLSLSLFSFGLSIQVFSFGLSILSLSYSLSLLFRPLSSFSLPLFSSLYLSLPSCLTISQSVSLTIF